MRLIRLLKHDLAKESVQWVQDNLISEQQAILICQRYGVDYTHIQTQTSAYRVLLGLGFLFLGLAAITLLSANWDTLPRGLRMGGLVGTTTAINLFAWLRYRQGERGAAIGWFLLGALFYGASIMLIAQIYHLGEHFPDGILWWAMGVLPLAFLLQSSVLMLLTSSLALLWACVEISLSFYPLGFVCFLSALLWFLHRYEQNIALFILFVCSICLWLEFSLAWLIADGYRFYYGAEHWVLTFGLFLFSYSLSKLMFAQHRHTTDSVWIDYGMVLNLWALRFALLSLFVLSFETPWQELLDAHWKQPIWALVLATLFSIGTVLVGICARAHLYPLLGLVFSYFGSINMIIFADASIAPWMQIIDNFLLLGIGVWLIVRGIHDGVSHYFFLGISVILILALLRYIDLVGDYIGTAILFSVFAVILISAAKYWQRHQGHTGGTQ